MCRMSKILVLQQGMRTYISRPGVDAYVPARHVRKKPGIAGTSTNAKAYGT
jgi:hypothetical protein